jgi:hypothetical protein
MWRMKMEQKIKSKLSLYGIVSALTFIYLILTNNPGISAPLFFVIQFVILFYIAKNKGGIVNIKVLFMLIPIFIISLNNFISANYMMMPTNFLAIVFLYSTMFLLLGNKLNLLKLSISEIFKIIVNVFEPIINFTVPFNWIAERSYNKEKNILAKRIIIGVLISVPSVIFLVMMLSKADLVFYNSFIIFNKWFKNLFEFINIFKIIVGTFAGFYLFSHLYSVFMKDDNSIANIISNKVNTAKKIKGDIIVFNILLMSVLAVYTIFIVIQFKYLFSGGVLPNGLNYSEYARRGFFELVVLSVLNIALILLTTYLLRDKIYENKNKWALFTKLMLLYLCVITGILLASSYYRMSLYDSAYGFTRLRVLVYIFLIFEAIGLLATLIYILRHNFNILTIYTVIFLAFYLTLNLVRIDEVIAKRNVDMYLSGRAEEIDIDYLMTLSQDALPQIIRLSESDVQIMTRVKTINYLKDISIYYAQMENNWQSYNLTIEKNKELLEASNNNWQ